MQTSPRYYRLYYRPETWQIGMAGRADAEVFGLERVPIFPYLTGRFSSYTTENAGAWNHGLTTLNENNYEELTIIFP